MMHYSGGYFDFVIAELLSASQSAKIVIPQTEAIPAGTIYRKYHPVRGWADFVQNVNNQPQEVLSSPRI